MTREQLNKLHELTENIKKQKDIASDLLRTAQDRFGGNKHKLVRDGQEVEIEEKILWLEVFHLGTSCEAGKILAKEHPEVFEAYGKESELAIELKKFCITELGFDNTAMTISDYLKTTEAMFKLLLEESK